MVGEAPGFAQEVRCVRIGDRDGVRWHVKGRLHSWGLRTRGIALGARVAPSFQLLQKVVKGPTTP